MSLNPLLLQALAASNGSSESPQDLLFSQLESENPELATLAKQLLTSHTEDDDPIEEDEQDEDTDRLTDDRLTDDSLTIDAAVEQAFEQQASVLEATEDKLERMSQVARQMRQKLGEVYPELAELRSRNERLAAALGACYLCWGKDLDCDLCDGQGRPGHFSPNSKRFQQYVLPATQRLRRHSESRASPGLYGAPAQPGEDIFGETRLPADPQRQINKKTGQWLL